MSFVKSTTNVRQNILIVCKNASDDKWLIAYCMPSGRKPSAIGH